MCGPGWPGRLRARPDSPRPSPRCRTWRCRWPRRPRRRLAPRRAVAAAGRAAHPSCRPSRNGPYLVTNVPRLTDHLGTDDQARAAARAVPLRRLGDQAAVRRQPRPERVHRRQGSQAGSRPARHLPRRAADHLRQPRHLPALGPVHRPAGHRVPHRQRAVRGPQRRPDGRDHPRRAGLPVGSAELRDRRHRGPRPGRLGWHPAAGDRGHQGRPVPDHRRDRSDGADGEPEAPGQGRLARALRAVPVRPLAEQAVLQRHALVRRLPRPGARPGRSRPCSSGRAGCPR